MARPKKMIDTSDPQKIENLEDRRKFYQSELARIKVEQASNKLIDGTIVKNQAFKTARTVRDALLAIPGRVSADLASETSTFEIEKILDTEIRTCLENLSKELELSNPEMEILDDDE
jgi:phage terminase Nu1 subunit (DNA packaging protein)